MGRAFNVKIDERVKVLMSDLSKHSDFFFLFSNKSLGLIIYKYMHKLCGLRGFGCLMVSLFALISGAPPTY